MPRRQKHVSRGKAKLTFWLEVRNNPKGYLGQMERREKKKNSWGAYRGF